MKINIEISQVSANEFNIYFQMSKPDDKVNYKYIDQHSKLVSELRKVQLSKNHDWIPKSRVGGKISK